MSDELRALYHISKSLVWGIVAILVCVLALVVFSLLLPFTLRSLVANGGPIQNQLAAVVLAEQIRNLAGLGSLMFILTIVVIFILIAASLILGVLRSKSLGQIGGAIQILEMRYAKGEITKDQFLEMKNTLQRSDLPEKSHSENSAS
jgi:uncharacterized membrane protein